MKLILRLIILRTGLTLSMMHSDAKILERYKQMNGQDSNSPIITGDDAVAQSGSTIPDNEDLNADNTLTELEEYYEYDMDLKPGQLDIGKEYIVDHIQTDDQGRLPEKVDLVLIPDSRQRI